MQQCRYIGDQEQLRELTALVRTDPSDSSRVLAQFDSLSHTYVAAHGLAHGWHAFRAEEFVPLTTEEKENEA